MPENFLKRTIEQVIESQKDDLHVIHQSKKQKYDAVENCRSDEDRNNSNGPVSIKVNSSKFSLNETERIDSRNLERTPYKTVLNRDFRGEAQVASNILKNIVMEKMNESQENEKSAFQRVQPASYPQIYPAMKGCLGNTNHLRPALLVNDVPNRLVRPTFATLQAPTHSRGTMAQPPRIMAPAIPIEVVSQTTRKVAGHDPDKSNGTTTSSTGTMTTLAKQTPIHSVHLTTKKPTSDVMPGTSIAYRTPGANYKNRHGKIKRPMNAFMVWARNYRSRLSEEMPQASNAQISVRLGEIWGSMTAAEKEKYFREAERIKIQHHKDFPGWVYQPKQKKLIPETQHDRLWARFGSNQPKPQTADATIASEPQKQTHTSVMVYPKVPVTTTAQITSPLPSFSELTQTVSSQTCSIMPLDNARQQATNTPGIEQDPVKVTQADDIPVSASQSNVSSVSRGSGLSVTTEAVTCAESQGSLSITPVSTVCSNPHVTVYQNVTSSARPMTTPSSSAMMTARPSPKGRPPSISRRVEKLPEGLTCQGQPRAKEKTPLKDRTPKTTATGTSSCGSDTKYLTVEPLSETTPVQGTTKQTEQGEDLWPYPIPSVEQEAHADVLFDEHLRYEREAGPEYMDPYNPFYYDGSYDDTRSGLQVDVNSWQRYLNYTKMQNDTEDKTNFGTCFSPTDDGCSSDDVSPTTAKSSFHRSFTPVQKDFENQQTKNNPGEKSSESFFASSLTSAINVLGDVNNGAATPESYTDVSNHHYHSDNAAHMSKLLTDMHQQNSGFQTLNLKSGNHQHNVSNIAYLGQETHIDQLQRDASDVPQQLHLGSGDQNDVRVRSLEGSPQGKSEDSRPLKKRTERYRRDYLGSISRLPSGDIPTATYLEDVVFLTSPEKISSQAISDGGLKPKKIAITDESKFGCHTASLQKVADVAIEKIGATRTTKTNNMKDGFRDISDIVSMTTQALDVLHDAPTTTSVAKTGVVKIKEEMHY